MQPITAENLANVANVANQATFEARADVLRRNLEQKRLRSQGKNDVDSFPR